uniref:Serine/threonine-protein kinase n=1 Tax=Solanum tuberosum TaxID=4113 RepID=M0ZXN8_SOLTU
MEADHPTIGEYTLTCKLGGGSSSTVWKAEHRTTGKVVALKQIDLLKLTRQLKNCLDCELNFLSSVEHPNIIRLFDVFQFCAGGDLAAYIRDHGRVQECVARKFMKQIVGAGLEVLSMHHILHRDLKPEVDMWSLGAIFFELLNGYPPFRGRTSVQILRNIKASLRLPFFEPILPQLHPGCVDLCSRLLSIDPEKRISFKEFCRHDFLKIDEGGDKRFC